MHWRNETKTNIAGKTKNKQNPPQSMPSTADMFSDPNKRNLVSEVSTKSVKVYGESNTTSIVAYDCGMKFNIIRYFVDEHNVKLTVVPFDYDLEANPSNIQWDGLFLSNGPGDPNMCPQTNSVKSAAYYSARITCTFSVRSPESCHNKSADFGFVQHE